MTAGPCHIVPCYRSCHILPWLRTGPRSAARLAAPRPCADEAARRWPGRFSSSAPLVASQLVSPRFWRYRPDDPPRSTCELAGPPSAAPRGRCRPHPAVRPAPGDGREGSAAGGGERLARPPYVAGCQPSACPAAFAAPMSAAAATNWATSLGWETMATRLWGFDPGGDHPAGERVRRVRRDRLVSRGDQIRAPQRFPGWDAHHVSEGGASCQGQARAGRR